MRRLFPIVAALTLIAPSCPRDYGPSDYAPDASWSFGQYETGADLVYVAGASAKGDSVYVIAMPGGDVIARIDGPDRRGWALAGGNLAYYSVMRTQTATMTIHRLDLRDGTRRRLITDERRGGHMVEPDGPVFGSLVISRDGRELVVARTLIDLGQAWLGRYDIERGTLLGEISWPVASPRAGIRLAAVHDGYAVVIHTPDSTGVPQQRMHIVDRDLRLLATLAEPDGVAAGEVCSAQLAPVTVGWATVCWWQGPYASVLFLDKVFRVVSRSTLVLRSLSVPGALRDDVPSAPRQEQRGAPTPSDVRAGREIGKAGGPERILTWSARGESIAILTDRGTHIRVNSDGRVEESALTGAVAPHIGSVREMKPGVVLAQWTWAGSSPSPEIVRIHLNEGTVQARATYAGYHPNFAGSGDRLYMLILRASSSGVDLQRLDPVTLAPIGAPVPVPQRDDIMIRGLAAVSPGR